VKAVLSTAEKASDAGAGLGRAVLWVNGCNESATRLYRSAGMEVAFSADRYVKQRS
jgi:hypothetical protein